MALLWGYNGAVGEKMIKLKKNMKSNMLFKPPPNPHVPSASGLAKNCGPSLKRSIKRTKHQPKTAQGAFPNLPFFEKFANATEPTAAGARSKKKAGLPLSPTAVCMFKKTETSTRAYRTTPAPKHAAARLRPKACCRLVCCAKMASSSHPTMDSRNAGRACCAWWL